MRTRGDYMKRRGLDERARATAIWEEMSDRGVTQMGTKNCAHFFAEQGFASLDEALARTPDGVLLEMRNCGVGLVSKLRAVARPYSGVSPTVMAPATADSALAYTVDEIIQRRILPLSKNGIYNAIADGTIPSVRIGRRILVPKAALERMLSGG